MKIYSIVFIWLTFMIAHNAAASEGAGIVLGVTSGKLYQRSNYKIESKVSWMHESAIMVPLPSECLIETASLYHASRLHLLNDKWDVNYRLRVFHLKTDYLFQHKSIRSCKSLGVYLFQF
jgi:hypothetical protein